MTNRRDESARDTSLAEVLRQMTLAQVETQRMMMLMSINIEFLEQVAYAATAAANFEQFQQWARDAATNYHERIENLPKVPKTD